MFVLEDAKLTTGDTPEFAVESIERWWRHEGKKKYPKSKKLFY